MVNHLKHHQEVPKEYLSSSPVQVVTPNVNPSMREARARAAEAAANAAEAERKANFDARNDEKRANRREAQAERGVELRGIFKDEGARRSDCSCNRRGYDY
jgi:hypothetical protein